MVDLQHVGAALDRLGYRGFATIEQDRTPGSGAPLEDLRRCVAALAQARVGKPPDVGSEVP
jgi:sugar phosphate isomerase/epimerase